MDNNNISDKKMVILKRFKDLISIIDANVDEGKDTAALFVYAGTDC